MKKIAFLCLGFFLSHAVDAQAQFTCGVRAGLNLSSKVGLLIGATADYSVNDKISIISGLFYTQYGNITAFYTYHPNDFIDTRNYIRIPLNARYAIGKRLFLHTGPYLGFIVYSEGKHKYTNPENGRKEVFYYDISQKYRSFDWGISVGAAMKFGNFQAALEWNEGLINISRYDCCSKYNRSFAITSTYMFGKNKRKKN